MYETFACLRAVKNYNIKPHFFLLWLNGDECDEKDYIFGVAIGFFVC